MSFAGTAICVAIIDDRRQLEQKKYERSMKARRHYRKITDDVKQAVRWFIIYCQHIPNGTDFRELTNEMFAEVEKELSHRSLKSLVYRTPLE